MLAVENNPCSAGTSASRLLLLESGEIMYVCVLPRLRLPVAPQMAGDATKVLAALPGQESPETSVKSENPFTSA